MAGAGRAPGARGRAGYTLIEVVIASLLLMMMTIPIMTAAFSGRQLTAKTTHRQVVAAAVQQAAEELKAYVVADQTLAKGPGDGPTGWLLPGDQSGLTALAAGHHELSPSVYLPSLAAAPYDGTLSYDVTVRATPQGPQPDVTFNAKWSEP